MPDNGTSNPRRQYEIRADAVKVGDYLVGLGRVRSIAKYGEPRDPA